MSDVEVELEDAIGLGAGRYDGDEAAARAGVPRAVSVRLWRALGFPDVADGERVFTDSDVEAMAIAARALQAGVSVEEVLQLTRVLATSMARVAEAQVALASPEGQNDFALEIFRTTPQLLEFMWRRHLLAAARRHLQGSASTGAGPSLAVGFADLVGFTALSQQLDARELAELVDRFTVVAHDTVVAAGGRVVKMIGDEVMFVIEDVAAGAEIALLLAETYRDEATLSDVRVGLAWGGVLVRDGDLFGPTVNLASRIVSIARPGSVVLADEVHDALVGQAGLAWRRMRPRWLKGIGRVTLWVLNRAPPSRD